jgi:hypothetical protein
VPVVELKRVPRGGQTSVTIENPGRFSRITAALINADSTQTGFSQDLADWNFDKDTQAIAAHVSTDFAPPRVRKRSPKPGSRVSRRGVVVITFSEPMANVSARTIDLLAPGGKQVSSRVTYDSAKRQARLVAKKPLRAKAKYQVKIGKTVVDMGDNQLPGEQRTWTFRTRSR